MSDCKNAEGIIVGKSEERFHPPDTAELNPKTQVEWGAHAPRVRFSAPFRGAPKRASATAARKTSNARKSFECFESVARKRLDVRRVQPHPWAGVLPNSGFRAKNNFCNCPFLRVQSRQ
jgi:hypothetical protein